MWCLHWEAQGLGRAASEDGGEGFLCACRSCQPAARLLSTVACISLTNNMRADFVHALEKSDFRRLLAVSNPEVTVPPESWESVFYCCLHTWLHTDTNPPSLSSISVPQHGGLRQLAAMSEVILCSVSVSGAISLQRHWLDSAKGPSDFKTAPRNEVNSLLGLRRNLSLTLKFFFWCLALLVSDSFANC